MAIPSKKSVPPAAPLKALPAPEKARESEEDGKPPEEHQEPKLHWLARALIQGIGAFMAGCAAGYAFSKAEAKFSSYGQNLFMKAMRMAEGGGYGRTSRWSGSAPVHDRGRGRSDDSENDPMGDRGGQPFQEEEEDDRL